MLIGAKTLSIILEFQRKCVPLRCLQFGKLYCFAEQRSIAQWLLGIFYAQYLKILGGCLYVVIVLFFGAKYVGL